MSTSLLNDAFGMRSYDYIRNDYLNGVTFLLLIDQFRHLTIMNFLRPAFTIFQNSSIRISNSTLHSLSTLCH